MVSVFLLLFLLPSSGVSSGRCSTCRAAPLSQERSLLQQGKNEEALAILQQLATTTPVPKGLHHDLGIAVVSHRQAG